MKSKPVITPSTLVGDLDPSIQDNRSMWQIKGLSRDQVCTLTRKALEVLATSSINQFIAHWAVTELSERDRELTEGGRRGPREY